MIFGGAYVVLKVKVSLLLTVYAGVHVCQC